MWARTVRRKLRDITGNNELRFFYSTGRFVRRSFAQKTSLSGSGDPKFSIALGVVPIEIALPAWRL